MTENADLSDVAYVCGLRKTEGTVSCWAYRAPRVDPGVARSSFVRTWTMEGLVKFVVLMRESDNAWGNLPSSEQERLLAQYFAWVEDLKEKGAFVGGQPLASGGRLLSRVDGKVVDGPFTETKDVLTGFFLIEAPDWDAAVELARGCPALGHGETVELRRVGHD